MIGAKRFVRTGRVVPGTSLLPIPFTIAAAVLILLAVTLTLDALASLGRITLYTWLSVGNVDDARAILEGILSAVSTVLALIFSVTLLVFSMAVSQFGPRLMPYFLRDRAMQVALGLFLATFLHSLTTFVVTGQRGDVVFVPQLTVLTSVVLVFVSFCYLVVYNHRVALAIQTNNVLARIVEDLNAAIRELSQPRVVNIGTGAVSPTLSKGDSLARFEGENSADAIRQRCMGQGSVLKAITSGYVQRIDRGRIVKMADRYRAVVCLAFRPGEFVIEGEALAHVLPASPANELEATIHNAVKIGQHRTLEQDAEFAFAQLSEIAIRALSPAINDTYTGLSSIDWLGDALRMIGAIPAAEDAWQTSRGTVRLLVPSLRFARVVRTAFDLIRQAAADNPAVCIRVLQTCARLALQLRDNEQRRAILDEVEAVHQTAAGMPDVRIDRTALEEAYRLARDRLGPV
jgi:uncharacterized membrane protein